MLRQQPAVLISQDAIAERVRILGEAISADYEGVSVVVVGVLTGALIFMSDLVRQLRCPIELDTVALASYGSATESSGEVQVLKDVAIPLKGRHVLIVEDIVDTGLTLSYLQTMLHAREPASLATCVLLDKPSRRRCKVNVKYRGFEIPDRFVVGYGLDDAGTCRNLPYIGVIEQ